MELVNERMLQFLGRQSRIVGHPIEETLTEAKKQGLIQLLDKVRQTKESVYVPQFPGVILINGVRETKYFSLIFKPYFLNPNDVEPNAIFCVVHNITEQVLTLQRLEEEKRRTQLALEVGELGMLSTDWKNNTATADQRALDIFGFIHPMPLNAYLERIHPEDRNLREIVAQQVNEQANFSFEMRLLFDDGSIRWVRSRGMIQKDIEGNLIGSFGVVQDITPQKEFSIILKQKVEERTRELEQQQSLLDNILKNSSNGISVSKVFRDESGKVIDAQTILANDSAVKYIGLPREIYLTKKATELEPAVMTSPYYQASIRTLETGEPFIMQYFMESTGRWLELTVSKLDFDHLIQVFTDITPIKKAQLDIEQSVDNLKQANMRLEEFTRAASHDLKEPIRKVQFFSGRLKNLLTNKLSEQEQLMFDKVENAVERMQTLVDELLEYSRLHQVPLEQSNVDLNSILRLVLSDFEIEIQEKKAKLEICVLPEVKGDPRQLRQLLENLLGNALKYTKADEIPVITVQSKKIRGEEAPVFLSQDELQRCFYQIDVKDNGIGFDAAEAERIFHVFTRLHGNKEFPGTGIGLAIVKRVAENHGGYVFANSKPGEGSCFSVLLPC